eukprot:scaffold236082_cov40-Prasinocladus_malaysianus.AAC.2
MALLTSHLPKAMCSLTASSAHASRLPPGSSKQPAMSFTPGEWGSWAGLMASTSAESSSELRLDEVMDLQDDIKQKLRALTPK